MVKFLVAYDLYVRYKALYKVIRVIVKGANEKNVRKKIEVILMPFFEGIKMVIMVI